MGNDNKLATNLIKSNCVTVSDIAVGLDVIRDLYSICDAKLKKEKK